VLHLVESALGDPKEAARCATFLGSLLGVDMEQNDELSAALSDARLMADQLQAAIYEFFIALAARGPVVLLIEDLQWADPASMEILEGLADRVTEYPMLILLTVRPEVADTRPRLFSRHDAIRLELPRLSAKDVAKLGAAIAGRAISPEVVEAVAERTGGNPLFVEQIIRVLAEDGLLESAPDRLPLPRSVEAAVQSRLDHLPGPEKDLCKRASLFGRPFVGPEVESLGSADSERLLASLRRRGLMVAGPRPPDGTPREHRFRSTLVADVAYRMLSDELRRELHRRAAQYLGNIGHAVSEEVAVHYERGHEPELAARHYAVAALEAAKRGDNATVLRCGKRAEKLGPPPEQVFPLHMAQAEALGFLGRRDEQGLELAEALHAAPGDRERARVMIAQATWLMRTTRLDDASEVAREAVENADRVGDAELRAFARVRYIAALVYTGKLDEAQSVLDETEPLLESLSAQTRAFVAEAKAHLAAALGDLGRREQAFQEAAELFRKTGDVRRAAANESNLADTYNRVGAYEEAERTLRDALDGCRQVGNRIGESYALLNLAYALGMLQRTDQALRTIEEARALPHVQEDPRLMLTLRLYRARVLMQAIDDPERAAGLAEEASRLAHEAGKLGMAALRVMALAIAAQVRLHEGDIEVALAASTQAMTGRDLLSSIEEDEAEVFLAHAKALVAAGRDEEAQKVVERGVERLRYIAARIADEKVRARFLSDVPAHRALMVGDIGGPNT
jgi:predicted ATPase